MKLLLYHYFVLMSACCVYLAYGVRYKDIAVISRLRRSMFALGKKAAKTLLKDADPIDHLNTAERMFYAKPGGYKRAVDDFYSLKPVEVRNFRRPDVPGGVFKGGRVGDRTLTLTKGDKDLPVMLSITKTVDISPDEKVSFPITFIVYFD